MKSGWNVRPLGDVCKLLNGRAYNKDELLAYGPTPVLRVGNFFTNRNWYYSDLELTEDKYCDDGDLLYAWSASFGPRIWQGGKVIFHYHIWKTQPDPDLIDKKFLFHFLDWDKENIKAAQGAGTTMIHVTKGSMEARLMPVPPLEEQRRIVAVLDEAIAGIADATANAQKNLVNVERLFRTIIETVISNVLSPKNVRLTDLTEIRSGGTPSRQQKSFWNGDIPWYSSGELGPTFTSDPREMISDAGLTGSSAKIFPAGSLLIGMYDTAALKMSLTDRSATFNQAIAGLMPSSHLNLEYVRYAIEAQRHDILALRRGVRQKNLNLSKICDVEIPVPTLIAQQEAATKLNEARKLTDQISQNLKCKLQMLEALKKSLLERAFAGELN